MRNALGSRPAWDTSLYGRGDFVSPTANMIEMAAIDTKWFRNLGDWDGTMPATFSFSGAPADGVRLSYIKPSLDSIWTPVRCNLRAQ